LASWALDATRNVGPLSAGMIILGILGLMGGLSLLMQRRLNKKLSDDPSQDVNLITHELMFTLPGLLILLLLAPFILIGRAARSLKNKASAAIKAAKAKASGEDEEAPTLKSKRSLQRRCSSPRSRRRSYSPPWGWRCSMSWA